MKCPSVLRLIVHQNRAIRSTFNSIWLARSRHGTMCWVCTTQMTSLRTILLGVSRFTGCSRVVPHWQKHLFCLLHSPLTVTRACSLVVPHWQKLLLCRQLHSPLAVTGTCSRIVHPWQKHLDFQQLHSHNTVTMACSMVVPHWQKHQSYLKLHSPKTVTSTCSRVVPHWQKHLIYQQLHSPINVTLKCSMVVAVWMKCVARCLPRTALATYQHTHLIGSPMYHRLVRSTRMLMRIGLQEQAVYLRGGIGSTKELLLSMTSRNLWRSGLHRMDLR